MAEKSLSDTMILRNSMRFNSLDEVLPGLSENNPWITWGFTSYACPAASRFRVQFNKVINNSNVITIDTSTIYKSYIIH